MIAKATRRGNLYQLDYSINTDRANFAYSPMTNEDIWHRRYGQLGLCNLQKLARESLVNGFDFDISRELTFCESCTQGKQHRTKFLTSTKKGIFTSRPCS